MVEVSKRTGDSATEYWPIYILFGQSGSGKSSVMHIFEDMNFFAVDGLPLSLTPQMLPILKETSLKNYQGMVIRVDIPQDTLSQKSVSKVLSELKKSFKGLKIIFLEANPQAIITRYTTTRRPHPFEKSGNGLESSINSEILALNFLREISDVIINTSSFSIHDLRRYVQSNFSPVPDGEKTMHLHIVSFGFKYGLPPDIDMLFDLRFLPNPYFDLSLRSFNGKNSKIKEFILQSEVGKTFISKLEDFFDFLLPKFTCDSRYRLTIAFGCTGGMHRSVAVAEEFYKFLSECGYVVTIEHRHLGKEE